MAFPLHWGTGLALGCTLLAQAPGPGARALAVRPASERRLALVIGNDGYQHVNQLRNARTDARAVAQGLERTGFQVTLRTDLGERAMKEALRSFKAQVGGGDVAVFFFAGHGVQLGGANYLLPTDIRDENEDQVRDESLSLQRVLEDLQDQRARFTLAIVDACRDNPFRTTGRSIGGRGLAPTTAATGQMVLFSAGAGQEALDSLGPGDRDPDSVFTRVFLKEMMRPGIPVDRVLRNVREEVVRLARTAGHEQVPALYDQALGEFYFIPGAALAQPPAPGPAAPAPASAPAPAGPPEPEWAVLPGLDPAGWWTCNEGGGTTVADRSGNGRAAALMNGPVWAQGAAGGALSFAGNAYLLLAKPLPLGRAWTISAWFQWPLPQTGSWHTVTRGSNDHQVLVHFDQVSLGAYDNATQTAFHDSGFKMNTLTPGWHHLAAVGAGGRTVFFVDGRQVGAIPWQSTDDVIAIGNLQYGGQAFGTLADVRIYTAALGADQVTALARGPLPRPAGWWRFDEGTGVTVADRSGQGFSGTLANGPAWVAGRSGSALKFSGSAVVALPGALPLGSLWTIAAWFQTPLPATGDWHTLTRGTADHQILVHPDQVSLGCYDNATGTGFHDSGFKMNTVAPGWHHLAAVGAGGRTQFYLDGLPVGASPWQSTSNVSTLGNLPGTTQAFGTLGEVRIYTAALTGTQVSALAEEPAPARRPPGAPPAPGQVLHAAPLDMAFVAVPAGSFRMGTDAADAELKTARPAHTVTLSRPFWMSRTPVTVAQFRAFAAATGYRTDAETGGGSSICTDGHWLMEPDATWRDPHVPQDDDCPVSCMSWNDAQAMVHWLDENNPRLGFRLPTEAEWEYACRAGTTGARYGDLGAIAWYGGNSGGRPHPVAQKQANAFGLYDMVGNVWQWVQDWDGADYYAASPPVDPQGPTTGTLRAIRAGSWLEGANCASAEFRHPGAPPAGRTFNLGFRLVAVPR